MVEIPCRGPIEATLLEMLGGLRSACTYLGAKNLDELAKNTTFVRVNRQLNETLSALKTDTSHGYKRLKNIVAEIEKE